MVTPLPSPQMGQWSQLPNIAESSDIPLPLTSFALSLMLVFRTNSSYGRWLEARMHWGSIVTYSRNFVRQVRTNQRVTTGPVDGEGDGRVRRDQPAASLGHSRLMCSELCTCVSRMPEPCACAAPRVGNQVAENPATSATAAWHVGPATWHA